MRKQDEQTGQCEPDEGGSPLLPASLEDAVPGCHGDDRLLWAGSLEKPLEQKRQGNSLVLISTQPVKWQ